MEQLSLTLLFDPDDPDLGNLGSGDLWSGADLDNWVRDVEKLDAHRVVKMKTPRGLRLQHSDV